MHKILLAALVSLALAACGSSGGTDNPPAPPAPVTPPPPPEPTFEERLADLAEFDPNACRAQTPGFEALGGWLKNDGRSMGGSRTWLRDSGDVNAPLDGQSHGANVNATFNACAVRDSAHYLQSADGFALEAALDEETPAKIILSSSYYLSGVSRRDEPLDWFHRLDGNNDDREHEILLVTALGNGNGNPTSRVSSTEYAASLTEALKSENVDAALWILVGGYSGSGDSRRPARDIERADGSLAGSSLCGDAEALCLFAPWNAEGWEGSSNWGGTSHATPQASAALDTVWAIWPDMGILDLRNLAFDCAENMTAEGVSNTDRTFSYSNGRSFTSTTNSTWGHGILSLTCLFTPNGGLQNPVTGNAISGGIIGPIAGPVTGATITGVDYTGRDFGYGFARPVARENFALAATANLRASGAISRTGGLGYAPGAFTALRSVGLRAHGRIVQSGRFAVDLTAAGNAIGVVSGWRIGGLTIRGGLAAQPEGAGSLTGSRAFRAPASVSAAVTAAYGKTLAFGFSTHVQADHWRTVAMQGRSLWEDADLRESRLSAAVVKRAGAHAFALQGVWRSGLSGSLRVDGRSWALAPQRETGVWLTWNLMR